MIRSEVESYERLRRGEFAELRNLQGVGQLLVAARIAQGISQRAYGQNIETTAKLFDESTLTTPRFRDLGRDD
jgi:hypothetical protein